MKYINAPLTQYMLSAGLDVLHSECKEWLNDIAFWQDESRFLIKVIRDKSHGALSDTINHVLHNAESELLQILESEAPGLHQSMLEHEAYLGTLLEGEATDQETYRQKHLELKESILRFDEHFRKLKKDLFTIIEQATKIHYNISAHYWKAYTHIDRRKAVEEVSGIINRYGTLKDTHVFSDIDISFGIEIPGNKVAELHSALSDYLKLDNEKLEVISQEDSCRILLNLTFTAASGNLKVEPGNADI